ncbi:MAG: T9SS type A sorting domain-containing protein, partial [Ignavibacteria bacterium]
QNYPNPFNPETKIDYDIAADGNVSIILYDMMGREVRELVNENKPAGYYSVKLNAGSIPSGVYFYRISAEGSTGHFTSIKKMVIVK